MRDPAEELEAIQADNRFRKTRTVLNHGPILEKDDRQFVQFASNDYLGLAQSTELVACFQEAVERFGVGSGASRLITGTQSAHSDLEEELADFKRTERALTFSSGYATAIGTLTSLLGKEDIVILDKLCHACLIDGARLSGATIRVFPHNDLNRLEKHLKWARSKALPKSRILITTESVFSMDGDLAPLKEIAELKQRYNALLLLDEAHAVGTIGPEGRGLADELRLNQDVDFAMGTLSKAIGVSGGYIAANSNWIDLLINRARSFIYSTAPPPAVAATASHSIRLIRDKEGEKRRARLKANIACLNRSLANAQSKSAIRPYILGDSEKALLVSRKLEENGFIVPAIRFPTVPRGTERLRISLSSEHSTNQIEDLANSIREICSGI